MAQRSTGEPKDSRIFLKVEYGSSQDNCTAPPHQGRKLQGRRGPCLCGLPIGEGREPSAWGPGHGPAWEGRVKPLCRGPLGP